jgi:hypothetical protein
MSGYFSFLLLSYLLFNSRRNYWPSSLLLSCYSLVYLPDASPHCTWLSVEEIRSRPCSQPEPSWVQGTEEGAQGIRRRNGTVSTCLVVIAQRQKIRSGFLLRWRCGMHSEQNGCVTAGDVHTLLRVFWRPTSIMLFLALTCKSRQAVIRAPCVYLWFLFVIVARWSATTYTRLLPFGEPDL